MLVMVKTRGQLVGEWLMVAAVGLAVGSFFVAAMVGEYNLSSYISRDGFLAAILRPAFRIEGIQYNTILLVSSGLFGVGAVLRWRIGLLTPDDQAVAAPQPRQRFWWKATAGLGLMAMVGWVFILSTNTFSTRLEQRASTGPVIRLSTSLGDIKIQLFQEEAPETVKNFLAYVNDGFYDGTIFHRVMPNFMIQGGGFTEAMQQKPTKPPVRNEAANGLTNDTGTLAMARTDAVHSATSQFFINVKDNDALNHTQQSYGYCVFARVVEGMDVVRAIEQVKTRRRGMHQNVPVEPVVIKSAKIVWPIHGQQQEKRRTRK